MDRHWEHLVPEVLPSTMVLRFWNSTLIFEVVISTTQAENPERVLPFWKEEG
jgi:hypothetical protein